MIALDLTYKITDDSGFIAIANPDKYNSFVNTDWDFDELNERFIQEMVNNSLVIWSTGLENEWNVRFLYHPSNLKEFRQFEKIIAVTNERLVLTNYEDLTMAAQFKDSTIPAELNADLFIPLANGRYRATIRQMFNPDNLSSALTSDIAHFEIVLSLLNDNNSVVERVENIYWNND